MSELSETHATLGQASLGICPLEMQSLREKCCTQSQRPPREKAAVVVRDVAHK